MLVLTSILHPFLLFAVDTWFPPFKFSLELLSRGSVAPYFATWPPTPYWSASTLRQYGNTQVLFALALGQSCLQEPAKEPAIEPAKDLFLIKAFPNAVTSTCSPDLSRVWSPPSWSLQLRAVPSLKTSQPIPHKPVMLSFEVHELQAISSPR